MLTLRRYADSTDRGGFKITSLGSLLGLDWDDIGQDSKQLPEEFLTFDRFFHSLMFLAPLTRLIVASRIERNLERSEV